MNDSAYSETLRASMQVWRVTPPADPNFRASVWARIETGRRVVAETWAAYVRRHALVWAVVALAGASGAAWHGQNFGREHNRAEHEAVLASYLAQIDARAMAH